MEPAVQARSMAAALRRKNLKKGLNFSIMLVGASGLGKSTFVNTLCETEVIPKRIVDGKVMLDRTVEITAHNVEIEEDGLRLSLTITDTPGFGQSINSSNHYQTILQHIEQQYDSVLSEETRIKRSPKFIDNRVHVLLYFIPPYAGGLKELDIEFMKALSHRVNLIPVIAKSDTLTKDELKEMKRNVMTDIEHYKIPIYDFPVDDEDEDDVKEENGELRALLPFAIVGAQQELVINGRRVRCREYPWGIVEVDNPQHADFSRLRYLLLNSHTTEFKDITHDILYEAYRTERLSSGEFTPQVTPITPQVERITSGISVGPSTPGMSRQASNVTGNVPHQE